MGEHFDALPEGFKERLAAWPEFALGLTQRLQILLTGRVRLTIHTHLKEPLPLDGAGPTDVRLDTDWPRLWKRKPVAFVAVTPEPDPTPPRRRVVRDTGREVDRRVAEAMGWIPSSRHAGLFFAPGDDPDGLTTVERSVPAFSTTSEGLGRMLEWAAREGLEPEIAARIQDESLIAKDRWWRVTLWIEPGNFLCENADTPSAALALAIVAWSDSLPPRGRA